MAEIGIPFKVEHGAFAAFALANDPDGISLMDSLVGAD
jgi:hypothetical protein